jgi:hypothetical protein
MMNRALEAVRRADATADDMMRGYVDTATGVVRRVAWIREAVEGQARRKAARAPEDAQTPARQAEGGSR